MPLRGGNTKLQIYILLQHLKVKFNLTFIFFLLMG